MELAVVNELLNVSVGSLIHNKLFSQFSQSLTYYNPPAPETLFATAPPAVAAQSTPRSATDAWLTSEGPLLLKKALGRLNLDINILSSATSKSELSLWTIDHLTSEKKRVKAELKYYDKVFKETLNRLPSKEEKEPMRPLYHYYRSLKQMITVKEEEQKTSNPPAPVEHPIKSKTAAVANIVNSTQALTEFTVQQLLSFKDQLRAVLHEYEKDFLKLHHRRIRYHKDISPVEKEYNRYKELKTELEKRGVDTKSTGGSSSFA
eukprot:GILI01012166.1.p1 GENE.GILI01012166.1~~GILI01012166.1.p1  ORF type:complete len:262 (-),score=86.17 GILI01012166.1:297-1082(-)